MDGPLEPDRRGRVAAPAAAPPDVLLEGVTKRYGAATAVAGLTLAIPRAAFVALLGPSGCGKTTTLRLIAGFERPDSGEVHIRGARVTTVPPYRRDFAMVFQNFALFPHMSVAENVGFGLRMIGLSGRDRAARVAEALALVKLGGLHARYPRQLSGGQQQRVAIARAIVMQPAVLLLDEPLGALDRNLREAMQVELRGLQRQLGITTVFVTHDQEEALTMADQVAVMHDGRIEQIGSPRDVYERPESGFVAGFLGAGNMLDGTVAALEPWGAWIDVAPGRLATAASGLMPGQQVRIVIRPERVRVLPPGETGMPATVRDLVYRGAALHLTFECGGLILLALVQNGAPGADSLVPGAPATLAFDRDGVIVLARP